MSETRESTAVPLIEFSSDFLIDPYRIYRQLREQGPVHHIRFASGVTGWMVTDYEAAREALADDRVRKNPAPSAAEMARQQSSGAILSAPELVSHMLNADPPDHTRMRKLVNKAFTRGAVERLQPRIEQITDELLDRMAEKDEVDLIGDYAIPIPFIVICELLGVPVSERDEFQKLSSAVLAPSAKSRGSEETTDKGDDSRPYTTEDEREVASSALIRYFVNLIAARTASPGDDLISGLIAANQEEDKITDSELIATIFLMLIAGHETTASLIGNGVLTILSNRNLLDQLISNPDAIPDAIEELLRFEGPVIMTSQRFTSEPVTIAGVDIPADERVWVALTAANRDPKQFACPDRASFDGAVESHLAFGHGIHHCIGAPLARLEARIAFGKLLQRYPGIHMAAPSQQAQWKLNTIFRGLSSLPVRLK